MADIGVVIVTFNRIEKLKLALNSYTRQSLQPKYILVIDNCSTDSTKEYLHTWQAETSTFMRKYVTLSKNCGGSGGFHCGLKLAIKLNANWIWVSDDDAYPDSDSFFNINAYLSTHDNSRIAALCGRVLTDGIIDTWHRRILKSRLRILYEQQVPTNCYDHEFKVTFFSYVGTIINKKALLQQGFPEKDFFIGYDDSEHSLRLSKFGDIICLPKVNITHDTNEIETSPYSWKKYYSIRNKLYSYRKHFPRYQADFLAVYYFFKSIKDPVRRAIAIEAIHDAYREKLGLHPKYRPGWKG